MKQYDVIVGFSINPEVTWTDVEKGPPDQKLRATANLHISGTSYNVALALRQCDYRVKLIGAAGENDLLRRVIEFDLRQRGVDCKIIPLREQTSLASIEPETRRRLSFKPPIIDFDRRRLSRQLNSSHAKYRVVTGLMPDDNEIKLAEIVLARDGGVRIVNPRLELTSDRCRFATVAKLADWLFVNRQEAAAYIGCQPMDLKADHAREFIRLGFKRVVITMDCDGALMVDNAGLVMDVPGNKVQLMAGEVGAGDCFLAFMLVGLMKGQGFKEALLLANMAASLKVQRIGTTNFPTYDEVAEQL
ncbi:MAG: PfkB family carbohydrate kinase [Patescibacteria group bacterium]